MNKKSKKLLTLCLTLAMVLTMTVFSSAAFAAKRYEGADRYNTAIEIVKAGWEKADTAVITTGGNSADALCAAPLAKSYDAPLLLTQKGAADAKGNVAVIKELKDLGVKNVIIVGGTTAVSKSVEDEIAKFATVKRVSGSDRYATSVEVAKALAAKTEKAPVEIAVANGADSAFADSLSISSIAAYKGMPILLTGKTALPKVVADYVKDLELTKSYVVGGTAVVSDNVAKALKESERLAGSNRYATNAAVLGAFDDVKYDKVYVATGEDFADALAGSALAAKTNSPIVLVGKKVVDKATKEFVDAKVKANTEVFVLGGEKAIPESIIDELFGGALRLTSTEATGVKKIEVGFNKPVDTTKATIEVKKGAVVTNIEKTVWSEDKKSVVLTTNVNLTKGEYTVNITVGDDKLSGKFTVEDEKPVSIELTSDKLALTDNTMETAKVGYVVYNQYKEDMTKRASLDWTVAPGTYDATNGVLTITAPKDTKFMLEQKVFVTALEKTKGVFMSATLTISRKPYIAEVKIGDLKSSDEKITTLNIKNIDKFYFPVTLKDQYGNLIKDTKTANDPLEILPILANIKGEFANDDNGDLIFKLKKADPQYAMTAMVTFVSGTSGARDEKKFEILPDSAVKNLSIEFPDTIAQGDSKVELKYSAVDQFGSEVKDLESLKEVEKRLNAAVPKEREVTFVFENDVKAKAVKLYVSVGENAAEGKVFIMMLTPANEMYSGSFNIAAKRKYTVVSGVKDVAVNYVAGATGTIGSENVTVVDQYGKTHSLEDLTGVNVKFKSLNPEILTVGSTLNGGKGNTVNVTSIKKGIATIEASIDGVKDSEKTFKINVVNEDAVKSYEVKDIAMLNGNTGAERDIVVVGKLEDGAEVVLKDDIIEKAVPSSGDVLVAGDKISAKTEGTTTDTKDITVSLVIVLKADVAPITKTVKVSYQKAVPAKVEAKSADKVEYVASTITDAEIQNLFKVTDQYGDKYPSTGLTVIKQEFSDKTGANVTVTTTNGLYDTLKLIYK